MWDFVEHVVTFVVPFVVPCLMSAILIWIMAFNQVRPNYQFVKGTTDEDLERRIRTRR